MDKQTATVTIRISTDKGYPDLTVEYILQFIDVALREANGLVPNLIGYGETTVAGVVIDA